MPDSSFDQSENKKKLHPTDDSFQFIVAKFFWNEYAKRCARVHDKEKYEKCQSLFNSLISTFSNPECHSKAYSNCYCQSSCEAYLYESFVNESSQRSDIDCISGRWKCSYDFRSDAINMREKFLKLAVMLQKNIHAIRMNFIQHMTFMN